MNALRRGLRQLARHALGALLALKGADRVAF